MIKGEGSEFELVRVPGGDRDAWLAQRRMGVGGSDVAAIMGLSKYKGPYGVYADKVGAAEPADISDRPAVHWGNVLEPVVGDEYRRNHPDREVRRVNAVLRSVARPWAQASLDYEVRDPDLGWGVLEIKTAGLMVAKDWEDGVPLYYQTQVFHYLSVTGRPFADVAVLIGGSDYREFRIIRDPEDVAAVEDAVDAFWHGNVEARVPPEPGAVDMGSVFAAHREPDGDVDALDGDPPELARYLIAKADAERAKRALDESAARLKEMVGDSRGFDCPSGRLLWVRSSARTYDYKRMDEENPGLRDGYCEVKPRDMGLRFRPAKD